VIKGENSSLNVVVVSDGNYVTEDLSCYRVRVWVDEIRIVVRNPTAG